ncbi:tetratricopeptide repeat-containing hybrid sensor histidine kinase/response regulator [Flavobacterium crassostreae]|uniref:histidine kinase n=1 Tax=Flavobacterium crassostreae TaxID=1763534 RepID=A0A1B9E3M0_9FLAO|nr:ATP-binding protein [Flavobacterium crassostreae]OCB76498.1 hybrid sensor histidine kinase/response regulator [Flavobacterium crassostreae]
MNYFWAFILFFSILMHAQKKEPLDSLSFYTGLAQSSIAKNHYKNAIDYTQKAINYSESKQDSYHKAVQIFQLGKIYYDLKKNNDAADFFNQSIYLFKNLPISSTYSIVYYYLGLVKMKQQNYDVAETCFKKSLSIAKKLNITTYNRAITLQQAIIYKAKGALEKSTVFFNTVISEPTTSKNLETKTEAYYQMGLIEAANKRFNFALSYFKKAYELNSSGQNLEQRLNILLALSTIHERMLEKNKAFAYLKLYLNLKENFEILNNQKLEIDDYENFKKEQRLKSVAQLNKQNAEKERTSKFSKLINILAVALIAILSLLSLSLYKNNIIRNKSNLLLKEKNNELLLAKEKIEKASEARSEFLSTVSHELRTPLNAINGLTHLLLEENPKKSQLHYLSSLKFSANYLATFINEILEINKIEANKTEVENISFNLKKLLEDIQNSLKELAQKNNNHFALSMDPEIPEILRGDPMKISQIFMNLINNALKFTQDGEVFVTAKVKQLSPQKAFLSFVITDTGIGIPENKLETVFESFTQGSTEINRKYGGTGLGLTIVKKLVTILGGKMHLKSTLGTGSAFSFDLELDIEENKNYSTQQTKATDYSALQNKKILIVEDNKINQMITKTMLKNKGVHSVIIDNGEEAMEHLKRHAYDLVLMDVHLPGINGTVATKEIRKFNTITPIIAVTAISLDENREMLLSFGMNDVVTKPFTPEDFYSIILQNLS